MSYLRRNGEFTNSPPEEFEKDEPEMSVETRFEAQIIDQDNKVVAVEAFNGYPSTNSIKWCFLRHKDKNPSKVNVKRVFVPVWD